MKKIVISLLLCLSCIGIGATNDTFDKKGNDLLLILSEGSVKLEFCTDAMFRVGHSQNGTFSKNEQWMVRKYEFSPVRFAVEDKGGEWNYYFIYGPDFYSMIDLYTDLTGKSPMLPRFAMGLHVGTYSGGTWKNEEMTSDKYPPALCKRLREEGVPFDLLWLDSTWRMFNTTYGNGGCSFEWRETFKDPKGMFDSCYAQNVKMVGLHIRSILDNGPKYKLLENVK